MCSRAAIPAAVGCDKRRYSEPTARLRVRPRSHGRRARRRQNAAVTGPTTSSVGADSGGEGLLGALWRQYAIEALVDLPLEGPLHRLEEHPQEDLDVGRLEEVEELLTCVVKPIDADELDAAALAAGRDSDS